jgi:hypothetical protein
VFFAGDFPQHGDHYGAWSLPPPLVAIVLVFGMGVVA